MVLTGSLGMGHHVITEVVTSSLAGLGFEPETVDCMSLLGPLSARVGDWTFRRLLDVPTLYDGLHFAHFRPGGRVADTVDRLATGRLVPALADVLADRPADLLLAAFATGASAAAQLAAATPPGRPRPTTVMLCTDVTPHRLWVQDGLDLFLVTSQAAAAAVRRYRPRAQIAVVPPPVRAAFADAPDRDTARRHLGLEAGARVTLLMGGGWGLGPLAETARSLAAEGVTVLAVAGRNRRLARTLQDVARRQPGVVPFGFVEDVPTLMAAADVVLTTPGATTCSEARVLDRPLVLLDVVPGHGRDNIQHELELGDAEVCDPDPGRLTASVLAVLDRVGAGTDDALCGGSTTTRTGSSGRTGLGPAAWEAAFAEALAVIGLGPVAPATGFRSMAAGAAPGGTPKVPATEEVD